MMALVDIKEIMTPATMKVKVNVLIKGYRGFLARLFLAKLIIYPVGYLLSKLVWAEVSFEWTAGEEGQENELE